MGRNGEISIQIEIEIPAMPAPPQKLEFDVPNLEQRHVLKRVKETTGIDVVTSKGEGRAILGFASWFASGCYARPETSPMLQRETIVLFLEPHDPYWYSVLFHELGHATGHQSRLARIGITNHEMYAFDMRVRAIEEIIAESVAARVMDRLALATETTRAKSRDYLRHFAEPVGIDIADSEIQHSIKLAYDLVMQWLEFMEISRYETKLGDLMKEFNKFF
jgi:hypothetical protein